jgi:hypothetical protein
MIDRFRRILDDLGHPLDGAELLDLLLLARTITGNGKDVAQASAADEGDNAAPQFEPPVSDSDVEHMDDSADSPGADPEPAREQEPGQVPEQRRLLFPDARATAPSGGAAAHVVRVPGPRSIPGAHHLIRSLRPLRAYRDDPHRPAVDVEATVRLAAESESFDVVLRPTRELQNAAVLLADDSSSMRVWRSLLPEVHRLLERSGIFRTVHIRRFSPPDLAWEAPGRQRMGAGPTVTLLLTDGVHPAWSSAAVAAAVAGLGTRGPLAVLTPLPQRLWRATAFQPQPYLFRAAQPFPTVQQLFMLDPLTEERQLLAPGQVPLPVIGLSPSSLGSWSQLVAKPSTSHLIDAAVLDAVSPDTPTKAEPTTGTASPDRMIAAFRGAFSPQAYRLAVRLSAIKPLSPPLMQLVRTATLPDATATHVAEVLLSGLLRRMHDDSDTQGLPEALHGHDLYDFRPGVRELLASGMSRAQTQEVAEAVGRALAPYLGRLPDFSVLTPGIKGTIRLSDEASPFAALDVPNTTPEQPLSLSEPSSDVSGMSSRAEERLSGLPGVALVKASARAVAAGIRNGSLIPFLIEQHLLAYGRKPGPAEVRAWERSLPALAAVLTDADLGDVQMLVEYALPRSTVRVQVVLAGMELSGLEPSYVLVELKDWVGAAPDDDNPDLCRVDGNSHYVLNPLESMRRSCEYLIQFNEVAHQHVPRVAAAVYLPNATGQSVNGLAGERGDIGVGLFTGERRGALLDFLRARFSGSHPGDRAVDELVAGKMVSPAELSAVAAQALNGRNQFILLGEQQIAYSVVLDTVRKAQRSDRKEVVVVTGGPGTGKSVIALKLMGDLYQQGVSVLHASGSKSFTQTMRKVVGGRSRPVANLFRYFNSFMTSDRNAIDVLICDEAQRMRATSANRFTSASRSPERSQVEELIDAARVPVFLLDEHQIVRSGEIGTVAEIAAAARSKGLPVHVVELTDQFRCGGSEAYPNWVRRLLGVESGGAVPWVPDGRMQLLVADGPEEMEAFLAARRSEGYSARMAAGYCWKWSPEPENGDPLPPDVVIGDWARPWNLRSDRSVSSAPPAALWATDPAGFGQVGTVYTAQGFEYDWNGVILGPDMVWRGDRFVTDRTSSRDPEFTRKSVSDTDADQLIRNVYKVLLTRGLTGTIIYSTDEETRAKLLALGALPLAAHPRWPQSSANAALAKWPYRLADLGPGITSGFHERDGRRAGHFEWKPGPAKSWWDVILQAPFIGVATPFHKQPSGGGSRSIRDNESWDHVSLPTDCVPRTNYRPAGSRVGFVSAQDRWVERDRLNQLRGDPAAAVAAQADVTATDLALGEEDREKAVDALLQEASMRPCSEFYRVAWRDMISSATERSLFAALIPPGATHVHTVHSAALLSRRLTALTAGFFAALPLDYFVRSSGRGRLGSSGAMGMPAPSPGHPLESALLLRTLRLNCQTSAYASLWEELYDPLWQQDTWAAAANWSKETPPLNEGVESTWTRDTPLRTEFSRRAALVEIDALVAVWLGVSADQLLALYEGRFPVLQRYEENLWFDATGRRIAKDHQQHGYGQPKDAWKQLSSHDAFPNEYNLPAGYAGPLHRANRKDEMRAAYVEFSRRLNEAGWKSGDAQPPEAANT